MAVTVCPGIAMTTRRRRRRRNFLYFRSLLETFVIRNCWSSASSCQSK